MKNLLTFDKPAVSIRLDIIDRIKMKNIQTWISENGISKCFFKFIISPRVENVDMLWYISCFDNFEKVKCVQICVGCWAFSRWHTRASRVVIKPGIASFTRTTLITGIRASIRCAIDTWAVKSDRLANFETIINTSSKFFIHAAYDVFDFTFADRNTVVIFFDITVYTVTAVSTVIVTNLIRLVACFVAIWGTETKFLINRTTRNRTSVIFDTASVYIVSVLNIAVSALTAPSTGVGSANRIELIYKGVACVITLLFTFKNSIKVLDLRIWGSYLRETRNFV